MSNLDKHRTMHEAFNRRDWTTVVQNFASDAEYTDQARGLVLKGPQDLVDYLKTNWVTAFSDAAVAEVGYIDAGDHVVAHFTGTGTNDGPFGPMPRTTRQIYIPFCEIMRFNTASQIVSGSLYYDQVTILVQLGHMEVPSAR
jgi:hypothetical protein